jgi:membrane protease YdiL (CAAX protease family)
VGKKVRALLEVTLLFLLVIGLCRLLFQFRSVPFISRTLPLWAAGLFLYVPLLLLFIQKKKPETWGLTLKGFLPSVGTALFISLLCLPAFLILHHLYQHFWLHVPGRFSLPADWSLLLLYHLVCVALPEEVFYRGYMQSRLNEVFPGRVSLLSSRVSTLLSARLGAGWLYTAVLFALGHYLIDFRVHTLATFFPGLAFGWLRERTGSVVASTIFHALCNGTVLLLT